MRLTDDVALNFNMSTAAVFLDIEEAFDTTWQSGLLYKLSKLEFSKSLIKLFGSFLSEIKFSVSVEGEISTTRKCKQEYHKVLFCPKPYLICILMMPPKTHRVHLALFANDTCLYVTDRKESFIVRKIQRGLRLMEA
jgi:hypothetical protein